MSTASHKSISDATNVVNLLHSALETANWQLVSEAYFMVSGEWVDIPEPEPMEELIVDCKNHDPDAILKSMMDRLEKLEKQNLPVSSAVPIADAAPKKNKKRGRPKGSTNKKKKTEVSPNEDFTVNSPKPKQTVQSSTENKFESMSGIIEEAEREAGYDSIDDSVYKKSERTRRQYSTKSVTCLQCLNKFEVNPIFARDNYVCDACISRRI